MVAVVIGTFLPWLRSGRATRNSYATDGAVRRLLDVSGPADAVLRAWPFVSILCAAAIVFVLLGLLRTGLVTAALAAVASGGVAIWALGTDVRGLIRPASAGPVVTLTGACLTAVGVIACASTFRRSTGGTREHTD